MKQTELAEALGLHPSVVVRDKARGMPVHSIEAARAWRLANVRVRAGSPTRTTTPPQITQHGECGTGAATEYASARARREVAEASLAELRMREQLGELVRADHVRAETAKIAIKIREAFLNLPDRLAPVVAAESDPGAVFRLLDLEFRQILTTLADDIAAER